MSGHTPGPWVAHELSIGFEIRMDGLPVDSQSPFEPQHVVRYAGTWLPVHQHREARANAHLIAAAPEMLEALQEVERHLAEQVLHCGGSREWERRVLHKRLGATRAAIAKATGGAL